MLYKPDRRRWIDAVIDYFGESRETRVPESRWEHEAIYCVVNALGTEEFC